MQKRCDLISEKFDGYSNSMLSFRKGKRASTIPLIVHLSKLNYYEWIEEIKEKLREIQNRNEGQWLVSGDRRIGVTGLPNWQLA